METEEKKTTFKTRKLYSGMSAIILMLVIGWIWDAIWTLYLITSIENPGDLQIKIDFIYGAFSYILLAAVIIAIVNTLKKSPIKNLQEDGLIKGLSIGFFVGGFIGLFTNFIFGWFIGFCILGLAYGLSSEFSGKKKKKVVVEQEEKK